MIENKDYNTVQDLSKRFMMGARNIRKIVDKLKSSVSSDLLGKDANGRWLIHNILASKFKPTRKLVQQYYALTIDPPSEFTEAEIHKVMQFVIDRMQGPTLEINYVIQKKKANGKKHLHCYINCKQRRKLLENLRLGFSNMGYKVTEINDLQGWKNYITRDGDKITTLKK